MLCTAEGKSLHVTLIPTLELYCEQSAVTSCRQVSTAKAIDEDEPSAAAVVGAAKGRLVSAMMKKHLCEAVVPVIIDLKRLLEARRHPLLGDLMAAIRALLKDYKSEVRRPGAPGFRRSLQSKRSEKVLPHQNRIRKHMV